MQQSTPAGLEAASQQSPNELALTHEAHVHGLRASSQQPSSLMQILLNLNAEVARHPRRSNPRMSFADFERALPEVDDMEHACKQFFLVSYKFETRTSGAFHVT